MHLPFGNLRSVGRAIDTKCCVGLSIAIRLDPLVGPAAAYAFSTLFREEQVQSLVSATIVAANMLFPASEDAQDIAYSTFGPGEPSVAYNGMWFVGDNYSGQNRATANRFISMLARPGRVDFFRVALARYIDAPVTATLLAGEDINTATELESITRSISAPGGPYWDLTSEIISFQSTSHPVLRPGETYWLALSAEPAVGQDGWEPGGWLTNDQGVEGDLAARVDSSSWYMYPTPLESLAFDVAITSTSVAPEPFSMFLLGTGLAGVSALRWRRRKSD